MQAKERVMERLSHEKKNRPTEKRHTSYKDANKVT